MTNITRLVGDIHGCFNYYKTYCLYNFEGNHIQVGDFGVGFGQSDYWHESVDSYMLATNGRFIRGNHDNPSVSRNMSSWIPDGYVENDTMFIGGAWSIDNPNAPIGWYKRTKNVDWWEDEECSDEQFERFYEVYQYAKPKVLITHDCPHFVARRLFWDSGKLTGMQYNTRTGNFLEKLTKVHQPEFHFFGHWHETSYYKHGNTYYVCLGILDYLDVDLSNPEQILEAIALKFS